MIVIAVFCKEDDIKRYYNMATTSRDRDIGLEWQPKTDTIKATVSVNESSEVL